MTAKQPSKTEISPAPERLGTDEEQDWGGYRAYLSRLSSDSLWDTLVHVDEERFPRRREAIEREMARRRLFFVSPYTDGEQKVRLLHINLLVFAFLAAVTHHIPTATTLINRAALALNNNSPVLSPSGQAVSLVSGLTSRETSVLDGLTYLCGGIAAVLLGIGVILLPFLTARLYHRSLSPDLFLLALISLPLGAGMLALVWL